MYCFSHHKPNIPVYMQGSELLQINLHISMVFIKNFKITVPINPSDPNSFLSKKIIGLIGPNRVPRQSPSCQRLLSFLKRKLANKIGSINEVY